MTQKTNAFRVALMVSLGGFIFGFDASVISGVVGFVATQFELNDWQQGLVVSAPTLSAAIAALCVGPLSDQIGRKKVLELIAFLYLLSAVASAFATGFVSLVFARFIGGLAFSSLIIAPMYIAEISPPRLRGKMVSFNQLNIVMGFSAAYFTNYLLLKASGRPDILASIPSFHEHVWRWMLAIEIIPALAYLLLLTTIPESPRWLVVKRLPEKARVILNTLMAPELVDGQIQEIQATVAKKEQPFKARLAMLFGPKMRFVLVIGLIVGISQQITGVNAIYFYAPAIFEQSGVGKDAAFAQAIWVGLINIVFTVLAMALIDKLGRKPLLLGGLTGVFLSMALCSFGFQQATYKLSPESVTSLPQALDTQKIATVTGRVFESDVDFKQALIQAVGPANAKKYESQLIKAAIHMNPWIILVGILGFVASFAVSLGPVMWVLFSEIYPNRIRGLAISLVGSVNSSVSFVVQLVFPWELSTLGTAGVFLIYGLFALLGLALVIRLLPETKNKSLEQLELDLIKS